MANFPTIAIGLPFVKAGGFSIQALAWRTSIETNGLNNLDRLNIYAGLSNSIAQRTCIIRGSLITPVSSPTFDVNGVKSSGTSYLNLNYNPAVNAVKLTLNSVSHGYLVKNPPFTGLVRAMGSRQGSITRISLIRDNTPQSLAYNNDATGAGNTSVATSGWVCCEGQRIDSSTGNFSIINGTYNAVTRTSISLPNSPTSELTEFNEVVPSGGYDTMYHGASWHGSGSIDNANLVAFLRNTFTALGV